ncbi:MAG: diguanylate cyclase [Rhodocyclaceae bacterium]
MPLAIETDAPAARILIIDDSAISIRLLSHFMRDLAEVQFATNGEDGLAMAMEDPPDLILLDVEMPGINGLEACRRIKQHPALTEIPVIFVTAHTDTEHEVAGLDAGANDFIPKPVSEPIVRARVKTHLKLKRQSDILRGLAMRDGLTGLFNRRAFDERLEQEYRRHLRHPASLGLAMIDVDQFKHYNDHYGHQAGDECLRQVAHAIRASARRPGEMVARFGGEEFVVLLPNCGEEDLTGYGEHLLRAVRDLRLPHEQSTHGLVTISVGLAAAAPGEALAFDAPQNGQGNTDLFPGMLIGAADRALYEAKGRGRNCFCAGTVSA